jgi:NAD(P)-dependent dehydrogenase (short-subunit alcohol dehydrogenase family)
MVHSGKTVALVTGATGVIGGAIARALAATPGFEVVILARDEDRARQAVRAIRGDSGNDSVRFVIANLSRRPSIRTLAASWNGPLHVLVNNAAVAPRKRETTPEAIELTFATNVLGYLWLADAFVPRLAAVAPARIVNVASNWAGDLDLDDLEFNRRRFDNNTAYRQSKQANRMLTAAQAERLADHGILVNACHPGNPSSALTRDLGFGGQQSAADAARTPVMLARGDLGGGVTGRYFDRGREALCRFSEDRAAIEQLHATCRGYG